MLVIAPPTRQTRAEQLTNDEHHFVIQRQVRYFFLFPPEIRRNFVREKVDIKNVILGERECEFLRLGVPLLRQIVVVIIFIRGEIVAYFENLAEGENL